MNLDMLPRRPTNTKKETGGLSLGVVGVCPLAVMLSAVTVVGLLTLLA